jgi:DNA-binding NarL/FixJ family response regulator
MRSGARGYLLKDAAAEDIVNAVRAVAGGTVVLGPSVARRLVQSAATSRSPVGAFPLLTERELEVLDLIAGGHNNAEIARRLVLSQKTVRNHVSNVFGKLQVADRAQAMLRAREAGLGQD